MDILDGALATKRQEATPRTTAPANTGGNPTLISPTTAPAPGSGDDVSASLPAQGVALALLLIGGFIAWVMNEDQGAFTPKDGFVLLTGFYVAAQAIERLLELLPGGTGTKQAKANRAVIFGAVGFVLAVLLAEWLGLYFVEAVGVGDVNSSLDVIITALAIGGGTKPLHDGIKRIEKAKETPPATT
jgi:hypothetical protein